MSQNEPTGDKPKIIVDEDWKSQVEAEKAANKEPAAGAEAPEGAMPAAPTGELQGEPDTEADPAMPPASLELLLSTLATEAMMALGVMPHPVTGEIEKRRNQAKYLIDTIEVLRDKTKGNLTAEESQAMEDMLHQLRMAFVTLGSA